MRAILLKGFGGVEAMEMGDAQVPECKEEEVILKVKAFGLNRADILQRKGLYPAPKGSSDILGLEASGVVEAVGKNVKGIKKGDRLAALLSGGAYAEYTTCHYKHTMPIPENMLYQDAAAIPEVFITAFQALCSIGKLKKGETLLIHAAASGVGTAAIQIAKNLGAVSIGTASNKKHQACVSIGLDHCIDYKNQDFVEEVNKITNNGGVDLLIDFVGGSYFQKNLQCVKLDGRMVMLGFLGGVKTSALNLASILRNRIQITGTTLRSRTDDYKAALIQAFKTEIYPLILDGKISPVIHKVFDWGQFKVAHQMMEKNENIGKIILNIES